MKTFLRTISFLFLAGLGYGCADPGMDLDADEVTADLDATKADAVPTPAGSFVRTTDARLGDIATLTLNADHTFARRFMVIDCLPTFGCHDEVGTFKLTRSTKTGTRFIRFYDADGTFMDRYVYTYSISQLALRRDDDKRFFTMSVTTP